jgi:hypothetical protein
MNTDRELDLGRRRTLAAGGAMMAGLVASTPDVAFGQAGPVVPPPTTGPVVPPPQTGTLPVLDIQRILRSSGHVSGPVLHIEQLRRDLNNVVGPANIPFRPAFGVHNDFYFQALPNGRAILNGELALRAGEINAVIDRILTTGLVFQALHQHFFDLEPQIWQVHLRGTGSPYAIARALEYVVRATGTPLPQVAPPNPSSPLDARRLGRLLGGEARIHEDGVVSVSILRREQVSLDGVPIDPRLGIAHEVLFEPLPNGRTAVAPAFALLAAEVGQVNRLMRREGFDIHALANHETAETPQLYFSHLLAVGNPYYFAFVIRRILQQTNTRFMP